MTDQSAGSGRETGPSIIVVPNGPYGVKGRVDVVRRRAVPGEDGHPQRWENHGDLGADRRRDDSGMVWLCRCGHSENKPFCDGHHKQVGFDGTEAAPTSTHQERAKVLGVPAGVDVVVRDDVAICEHAGFCVAGDTNVWKLAKQADDASARSRMEGMIDHCPSGRLSREAAGADGEPDLPVAMGVVDNGPLAVTGRVGITRSDKQPLEPRNRVTLCRCGASKIKPLCDGSHAKVGFTDH